MKDIYSEAFALELDSKKVFPSFRERFHYPLIKDLPEVDLSLVENENSECIYLCGNSLGLQPKTAREYVNRQFDKWAKIGVHGHVLGELPWATCEDPLRPAMAKLIGASIDEVNLMNFLSVNLHLLMVSFYQPTEKRFKILIEDKAFPSDHYIVESQIKLHNLEPSECMVLIKPREGETYFRTEDIIKSIENEGDSLAVVLLSGVQYFTGQFFEIEKITAAAHSVGAYAGWDLAHAVGNVELKLHDWKVDFAAWCSYKYLNSGAGGIGGIFLHENNFEISKQKKLDGWWSHRYETRFEMSNRMEYAKGALAFGLSNTSMLLTSCLKASLDIFDEVGMAYLRRRSLILTAYLEAIIKKNYEEKKDKIFFDSLTPTDPEQRGAQISLRFSSNVRKVHAELEKRGVLCDFREPNVLRFAPAPLYNNFHELYRFSKILNECFLACESEE